MSDDHHPPRTVLARPARALALVLMVGGFVAYVRANNAEASAIFRAGGDAGMWGVGILFAAVLLVPGAILLLVSLAIGPRTGGRPTAVVAGLALLTPTVWLGVNLYPPDRRTTEGSPLAPGRWEHVADLYLVAFVLLGAAGVLLLLSAAVVPRTRCSPAPSASPRADLR